MPRQLMGEFEHLILLAIIRLQDDAYGVTIVREVEERTGREVSIAATYLTLRRLEDKRWVRGHKGNATARRGGRPKTYYDVTATGKEKLKESREGLMKMWAGITEKLS